MRLHPAEIRIRKLAKETPAVLILFDLLVTPAEENLLDTRTWSGARIWKGFMRLSALRRV
jgi:hypothetical protein